MMSAADSRAWRIWTRYLTLAPQADRCAWACRLCSEGSLDRDPVAAIRDHLATAHGTVTTTTVSTDVRDSIYRGTRWGR